jgi:hypothetical protein
VEVIGKHGPFLVVDLDCEAQLVNLISLAASPYLEENVPFAALLPYKEEAMLETE